MAHSSIVVEGGLFPSDFMERIAVGEVGGQRASDFGLSRNQRLTNEILSAFSDANLYWGSFQRRLARSSVSKTTLTRQDWTEKLMEVLGYETLNRERIEPLDGTQSYNIYARVGEGESASPFHIVSIEQPLDSRPSRNRRSPHATVQEYLNNSDALWGIVTNGGRLRLLRNSTRISHPTYIEFDIQGMIESNQFADFATLYRLIHRTRFPGDDAPPQDCLLEQYYQQGIDEHSRVRDKLRDGVEQALKTLGNAFLAHSASDEIRESLETGALNGENYYRQLLRLVYRLLFLMVAEERRLLKPADDSDAGLQRIYDRYYSITRVRARAEHYFADDRNSDIWESVKQAFRLFRDDETAAKLGFNALDGELFGYSACKDLELSGCSNRDFLEAMLNLSTFMDENNIRRRVNYAGIDVEEFGSVYESLLDFHPSVESIGGQPSFALVSGTERKETGSYYTPPDLVHELIESTLVPVVNERLRRTRGVERKIEALLSLKVCDPAAGSGHFLLAAARRIAREVAKLRSGEAEPSPSAYRAALRDTIRSCIYAVDRNPLAVDLCKVALWIEGHEPGLPLSFLDHRVKCGDSLVGVAYLDALEAGIPDKAYTALDGDDRAAATLYRNRNRAERKGAIQHPFKEASNPSNVLMETAVEYETFSELEEANAQDVRAKSAIFQSMRGSNTDWFTLKVACDMWTASFFMPKLVMKEFGGEGVPTTGTIRRWLHSREVRGDFTGKVVQLATDLRFFHWPLEFPEVFVNDGGFDVVLGNPPWEVIQPEEQKFFGINDPRISELSGQTRKNAIRALPNSNPSLGALWEAHKYNIRAVSNFARGGRFPMGSRGKINTYAVFTELARQLLNLNGRSGIIVPTGIATDNNTSILFSHLIESRSLVSLYDFENRQKVFPGIDSRIKFCLLTMAGNNAHIDTPEFAFFLHRTSQLRDEGRRFDMSYKDFGLFNPNTRNCPIFRTRRDIEIARKMYDRAGVLLDDYSEYGNPWGVSLSTMFNMTSDSRHFRTREQLEADGWILDGNVFVRNDECCLPLYEGKMFHQYDHRYATFDDVSTSDVRKGNAREMSADEKIGLSAGIIPRYWVLEEEVSRRRQPEATAGGDSRRRQPEATAGGDSRRRQPEATAGGDSRRRQPEATAIRAPRKSGARIAIRDIARATDRRTTVASLTPHYGLGHTAYIISIG